MNKIDIKNWQKYKITDFFAPLSVSKKLTKIELEDDGEIPVYSSEILNNGIFGYTNKEPEFIISNQTPFYLIFGDHTKSMNIAESNFCVMDNVKVLKPKININILKTKYITTVWKSSIPNLGYARHWSVAEKIDILLPTTSKGKPDWEYMESYMKNIMQESEENIRNLQNINNSKKKINLSNWKSFKIGSLFEPLKTGYIGSGKKIGSATKKPDKEHTIPLTCAKYGDNGIMYWGKKGDFITHSNILAVIRDGAVATGMVYAEKDETGVYSHSYFIKLKNYDVSFEVNLYLSCILTKTIYPKYTRDDTCIWERIQEDEILLPVSSNNEPDWEYMENYMKNIMQDTQSKLDKLVCC